MTNAHVSGPNFFLMGAPKTGTTALAQYLGAHPEVFFVPGKEPNFFNRDHDYYAYPDRDPDSIEQYLDLYRAAPASARAIGEGSVWYLYSEVAAERIRAFAPDARLLMIVRNPVDLVCSLHAQLLYTMDERVEDLETAWALQTARRAGDRVPDTCRQPSFLQYADVARLSHQIRRVRKSFPPEQTRVLVYDDLARDPGHVYRETLSFLGLDDDGRREFERVNARKGHRSGALARFTQRPPKPLLTAARGVKRVLGVERLNVLGRLRAVNRAAETRAVVSASMRERLAVFFREEVRELEAILGRDLSHWTDPSVEVGG